jgi:hypothetical protein
MNPSRQLPCTPFLRLLVVLGVLVPASANSERSSMSVRQCAVCTRGSGWGSCTTHYEAHLLRETTSWSLSLVILSTVIQLPMAHNTSPPIHPTMPARSPAVGAFIEHGLPLIR